MELKFKANRNTSICLAVGEALYAPGHGPTEDGTEHLSRSVLQVVFQARGVFKGHVTTVGRGDYPHAHRGIYLRGGLLKIGCCEFNKTETARLRKWALKKEK